MSLPLPASLRVLLHDDVAVLRLCRAAKRNALDDASVVGLLDFFTAPGAGVRAVVLDADGDHFCAGVDLAALAALSPLAGVEHSLMWHHALERIESGSVPVVSVLKGAVIGGGLELACATHLRVAEPSAFYSLPEGQHGLFVGGGAAVRLPRLIGLHRMTDLMLTGRVYLAEEGQQVGLSHYLVEAGQGLEFALGLARRIARNAPLTNYAVLHVLPRIAAAHPSEGYLLESLMSGLAAGSDEAQTRIAAFLKDRAGRK